MNSIGRAGVLAALGGVVLATLVLTTGCGDQPPSSPPGPPSIPTGAPPTIPTGAPPARPSRPAPVPDPLTTNPPPGGSAVPAAQVDAENLPPGFPTLVWTRGPRTLGVYGRAGGCTEARAEVVDQDGTQVRVRVVQYSTGPGPCTREVRYPPLEVALADDLGPRRVILVGLTS